MAGNHWCDLTGAGDHQEGYHPYLEMPEHWTRSDRPGNDNIKMRVRTFLTVVSYIVSHFHNKPNPNSLSHNLTSAGRCEYCSRGDDGVL